MTRGILILIFMILIMGLMVTKKIPTVLALFVLAIGICVIGGVPMIAVDVEGNEIGFLKSVIQLGSVRLGDAIMVAIFAGWLGMIMEKTGISETMIKKGAELGGDKTMIVTIILFTLSSLLFMVVNGLGTVIMIGTIVIPILISVGLDKLTASAAMLFAYCVGNSINLSNVNALAGITGATYDDTFLILAICAGVEFAAGILFFIISTRKIGKKFAFSGPVNDNVITEYQLKGAMGGLAMLAPIIPLGFVLILKFPLIPSFLIAVVWASVFTCNGHTWKSTMNMLTKSMFDGFSSTAPSVTLMIGIGMLLAAINQEGIKNSLSPIMRMITPHTIVPFLLFFIILAPLCLYRGPLNLWGLGAGIATLMVGINALPLNAIMGGFCSVSIMQLLCCPTNTHNVWVCSYTSEEVTAVTKRLLLWSWPAVAIGVIASAIMWI